MRACLILLLALLGHAPSSHAQSLSDSIPTQPPVSAVVRGHVSTPGREHETPVPGVMVTLHRVGDDSAGPLDSVVTDAQGRYRLAYQRFGSEQAVYFAAVVYRGIAYFSSPLRQLTVTGDDAEIMVFDTTSRRVEFHVQGHHFVVGAPRPDGAREVVEVWEISNDTSVTVIGRDSLDAVWSTPLPTGAVEFRAREGDVSAGSVQAVHDSVQLIVAFGPGIKQVSYSYVLPPSRFPFTITLAAPTSVLEVLLEEPTASASGPALKRVDNATSAGRTFQRFLGQDVARGQEIRIAVPASTAGQRQAVFIGVAALIGVAMLVAFLRSASAGRARAVPSSPVDTERLRLLGEIAVLDARLEGDAVSDPALATQRAALKRALAEVLAQDAAPG